MIVDLLIRGHVARLTQSLPPKARGEHRGRIFGSLIICQRGPSPEVGGHRVDYRRPVAQ